MTALAEVSKSSSIESDLRPATAATLQKIFSEKRNVTSQVTYGEVQTLIAALNIPGAALIRNKHSLRIVVGGKPIYFTHIRHEGQIERTYLHYNSVRSFAEALVANDIITPEVAAAHGLSKYSFYKELSAAKRKTHAVPANDKVEVASPSISTRLRTQAAPENTLLARGQTLRQDYLDFIADKNFLREESNILALALAGMVLASANGTSNKNSFKDALSMSEMIYDSFKEGMRSRVPHPLYLARPQLMILWHLLSLDSSDKTRFAQQIFGSQLDEEVSPADFLAAAAKAGIDSALPLAAVYGNCKELLDRKINLAYVRDDEYKRRKRRSLDKLLGVSERARDAAAALPAPLRELAEGLVGINRGEGGSTKPAAVITPPFSVSALVPFSDLVQRSPQAVSLTINPSDWDILPGFVPPEEIIKKIKSAASTNRLLDDLASICGSLEGYYHAYKDDWVNLGVVEARKRAFEKQAGKGKPTTFERLTTNHLFVLYRLLMLPRFQPEEQRYWHAPLIEGCTVENLAILLVKQLPGADERNVPAARNKFLLGRITNMRSRSLGLQSLDLPEHLLAAGEPLADLATELARVEPTRQEKIMARFAEMEDNSIVPAGHVLSDKILSDLANPHKKQGVLTDVAKLAYFAVMLDHVCCMFVDGKVTLDENGRFRGTKQDAEIFTRFQEAAMTTRMSHDAIHILYLLLRSRHEELLSTALTDPCGAEIDITELGHIMAGDKLLLHQTLHTQRPTGHYQRVMRALANDSGLLPAQVSAQHALAQARGENGR